MQQALGLVKLGGKVHRGLSRLRAFAMQTVARAHQQDRGNDREQHHAAEQREGDEFVVVGPPRQRKSRKTEAGP